MTYTSAMGGLIRASSHFITAHKGDATEIVEAVGSRIFNPDVDMDHVKSWFGGVKYFPHVDEICRMLDQEAPTDVRSKDLDPTEAEYGNHQSANQHGELIWKKVVADVKMGRAFPFEASHAWEIKQMRISPLEVVLGSKLRTIHDLSFSPSRDRSSLNHLTDAKKAPRSGLGHVLPDVLTCIMYLRQRLGRTAHIVLSKVNVKDACRQIRVNSAGTPAFGYRLGDTVVVDP